MVKESISANKANIAALVDDAGFLAEKLLRSGDDILCNGLLRANHGAEIALNRKYLRLIESTNNSYMIYAANGNGLKGPSGAAPAKGHGFESTAVRIRTVDHNTGGFIVENSSEKMLLSVRGSDGLTASAGALLANGVATAFSVHGYACFGHQSQNDNSSCALLQTATGHTVIQSKGTDNLIRCNAGGKTMLEIGTNGTNVQNELKINNVQVLATLNSLAARVNTLETTVNTLNTTTVKNGSDVSLMCVKNHKFVYANGAETYYRANGNHSHQAEARFYVRLI